MTRKAIFGENPEKALWWRLGHFKNVEQTTALIRSLHSTASDQNALKQANQIRYCIEQAEEYFRSAEVVSIATKPLPLYYGMASLSWALILLKKTGDYALDNLRSEHQDHGLTRPGLNYADRNLDLPSILEAVRTTVSSPILIGGNSRELRGTFGLLFSVARPEPVGVPISRQRGIITERTVRMMSVTNITLDIDQLASAALTLARFLLDIPDMVASFGELGIRPPFVYCSDVKMVQRDDNTVQLFVVTSRNTEGEVVQLEARLQRYQGARISRVSSGICAEFTAQQGQINFLVPQISETIDGRYFLYLPEQPDQLPEPCAFLGGMFLLGMLVRYYPHIWMQLLERHHPLVQVVEAFLPIAQRKFPNLVLNNLTGDSYIFRHQEAGD
jgi:hypothetical protein